MPDWADFSVYLCTPLCKGMAACVRSIITLFACLFFGCARAGVSIPDSCCRSTIDYRYTHTHTYVRVQTHDLFVLMAFTCLQTCWFARGCFLSFLLVLSNEPWWNQTTRVNNFPLSSNVTWFLYNQATASHLFLEYQGLEDRYSLWRHILIPESLCTSEDPVSQYGLIASEQGGVDCGC